VALRFRAPILAKLLVALVIPAVALFTLFAFVAFEVSRRDLDDELGRRLEAIASSTATQIRAKYLLLEADAPARAYNNAVQKLHAISQVTGAQLSIVERNEDTSGRMQFVLRADDTGTSKFGTPDFRAELDRSELDRVLSLGDAASSVTFEGNDGRIYKAGYAPVRACADCIGESENDNAIVFALRAQAPASYFDRLADLRDRLFLWGGGLAAVSILAAVIATLFITRNVRRLADAAERIGAGDLRAPIDVTTRDELGSLGQSMERMRRQLAERDARMQQMLAGIAHEVRNPLAGMTLFAGILRDELPESDERRGHVDKIQRELGYLERLVNEFLEYARRPPPDLAPVDLDELFAEVAQLATSPDVEVGVARCGLVARADRGQLRRALLNLARNAVQAATAAGHRGTGAVELRARTVDAELHVVVWNRGKEIPAETSGKLFEPFYTTREKGTGLGLAFVREIAVDHGGRVDVASAGGETTFTLVLPA
jgi:signal transduction histidine kinase